VLGLVHPWLILLNLGNSCQAASRNRPLTFIVIFGLELKVRLLDKRNTDIQVPSFDRAGELIEARTCAGVES